MMDFVHRHSSAEPYIDPTTGIVYEQLGDTVLVLGKRGALLGRTTNDAQPKSERSENLIGFSSDASMLLGPADRADIPIETASFKDVTIRHHPFKFVGGLPPELRVEPALSAEIRPTGASAAVVANDSYGAILNLRTADAAGSRARVYAPLMRMRPVPQSKLALWFYPASTGRQFIDYGLRDASMANGISLQRIDTDVEGAWWGVVTINGTAQYTPLIDPTTAAPFKTAGARSFIAIAVVHDGVEFIGGDGHANRGMVIGKRVGSIPTVGLMPSLMIEATTSASRELTMTHGEMVWPG